MMTVICLITVVANHFQSTAEVRGVVKEESGLHYLVDFSKDAKERGFNGDYSERIIEKDKCIQLGKGK